jgi:hypothetical protein
MARHGDQPQNREESVDERGTSGPWQDPVRYLANWFLPAFGKFPNPLFSSRPHEDLDELTSVLIRIRTKQKIALIDVRLNDRALRESLLEPLDLP